MTRLLGKLMLRAQRASFIGPTLRRLILNSMGARLHATAVIQHSCWLGSAKMEMGQHTLINAFAFFDGSDWLMLGDGAEIAVRATIITRHDDISSDAGRRSDPLSVSVKPIKVGKGAWIGVSCTLLPGAAIAPGCVIGAGTTINRPTDPDTLYSGGGGPRRIRSL